MAESEPGNQPGEESLIDQMQAIKTKNAADLIAVREKYDETIQSSEVEFQKRWEDMTKGLLGIDQKETPRTLPKIWTKHEIKTRPGEYAIGFRLSNPQVNAYRKVFENSQKIIIPIVLNTPEPNARLDLVPSILAQMQNTLHDPIMAGKLNLDRTEATAVTDRVSSFEKFGFLGALFTKLKNQRLSILVVAENPTVRKTIEAIAVAKGVSAVVFGDLSSFLPGIGASNSQLRVGIVSSRYEGQNTMRNAHIIIAMDESFDPFATHIIESRRNWYGAPGEAPVLRLFYFNTFEQLAFIFAPDPAHRSADALRDLIKYSFTNLVEDAKSPTYQLGHEELVQKIYEWISSATGKPKVAPSVFLPAIPEVNIMGPGNQSGPANSALASTAVSPRPESLDAGNESEAGRKRKRIAEATEAAKRLKQTEARSGPVTAGGIDEVYDENYDYDSLTKDELILRLRTIYKRHQEHARSFDRAQKLHIESRDAVKTLTNKVEDQATAIERNKDTIARLRIQADNHKTERTELQRRVRELQDAIEKGDASESVKNWRRLMTENNSLKDQLAKRDDKIKQKESDLDFFREQYQTAQSNAQGASNELETLKEEYEKVKEQADGNANKLREMSFTQERKDLNLKIKTLEGKLEFANKRIKDLMEENGGPGLLGDEDFGMY